MAVAGTLQTVSTYGWFGGDNNVNGANDQAGASGSVLTAPATYGWFSELLVVVATLKLPLTLEAFVDHTLEARCT